MKYVRLGSEGVATLILGQSPPSSDYNNDGTGLPFFQGKADFGLRSPKVRLWCSAPLKIAKPNDALVSVRAPVGAVNIADRECCIGRGLAAVRPGPHMRPRFLFHALASQRSVIEGMGTGTTFQSVNRTALESLQMPLPSIDEQVAIADLLDLVQKAIETENFWLTAAEQVKDALLADVLSRGLHSEVLKGSEAGQFPESWQVVPLGDLGRIGNGSTPLKSNEAYWSEGTIPWLTSAKVYDVTITQAEQFVTELAQRECHLPMVKAGSVLIAITGQGKTLGHAAVTMIDTCVSQHIAYVQFNADVNPHFVRLFLESRYDQLRAIAQGGGSTKGALTCGFLKKYPVPLPPRAEQDTIVAHVMDLESAIGLHERRRTVYVESYEAALHGLMSGHLILKPRAITRPSVANA